MVRDRHLHLSSAPRENGHRPAIDPTLRSAAEGYGAAAAGVLLTGTGDDGAAGLLAVHRAGGATAVQDPDEALYDAMPRAALRHVAVDAVLPVDEVGAWIAQLYAAPATVARSAMPPPDARRHRSSSRAVDTLPPGRDPASAVPDASGAATRFTCPDCGGVLFASEEPGLLTFNCSVGHKYSPDSLVAANRDGVEAALWRAVRTLEDRIVLLSRMADRARAAGLDRSARSMESQARDLLARAATIREAITAMPGADVS
jgi:two-component system chemotaxis response regulator CheB